MANGTIKRDAVSVNSGYILNVTKPTENRMIIRLAPEDGTDVGGIRLSLDGTTATFEKRTSSGWVTLKSW